MTVAAWFENWIIESLAASDCEQATKDLRAALARTHLVPRAGTIPSANCVLRSRGAPHHQTGGLPGGVDGRDDPHGSAVGAGQRGRPPLPGRCDDRASVGRLDHRGRAQVSREPVSTGAGAAWVAAQLASIFSPSSDADPGWAV